MALERIGEDADPSDTIMWYEDDAVPGDDHELVTTHLALALAKLPSEGNDIYFLSRNAYCSGCSISPGWKRSGTFSFGTAAVLFSIESIRTIHTWLLRHGTGSPIDLLLFELAGEGVINSWDWEGTACPENGMFCSIFKQYEVYCSDTGKEKEGRMTRTLSTMDEK